LRVAEIIANGREWAAVGRQPQNLREDFEPVELIERNAVREVRDTKLCWVA